MELSTTPGDSGEPLSGHTSALRRLSQDIAYFSDPDVRALLESTPVHGNLSRFEIASTLSPAQLRADVLSLRAELSSVVADRNAARAEAAKSDERAKRLQDEANRMKNELEATKSAARIKEDSLQEEIRKLEQDRILLAEDSAEKTTLLRQRTRFLQDSAHTPTSASRAGVPNGVLSDSSFTTITPAQYHESVAKCERLRKELSAAKSELLEISSAHHRELKSRDERLRNLEHDVLTLRSARSQADAARRAAHRQHSTKEASLRADIVSAKAELAARVGDLIQVRASAAELEAKLFALEREKRLRESSEFVLGSSAPGTTTAMSLPSAFQKPALPAENGTADEYTKVTIDTLKSEVEQLSTWVRAISPNGTSLEDGLAVLRKAAMAAEATSELKQPGHENAGDTPFSGPREGEGDSKNLKDFQVGRNDDLFSGNSNMQQQHKIALARLSHRVQELSSKLTEAENEVTRIAAERDESKMFYKRSERLRQLLERKSTHLKLALDEIEGAIGHGEDDSTHALNRLRDRLKAVEVEASSYKVAAEKYEAELKRSNAEIRKLTTDVLVLKKAACLEKDHGDTISFLRSQLMQAMKEASEATTQRDEAQSCNSTLSALIEDLRDKVASTRLHTGSSADEFENLDYDPRLLKVVRLKAGLAEEFLNSKVEGKDPIPKRRRLDENEITVQSQNQHVQDRGSGAEYGIVKNLEMKLQELEKRNTELEKLSKLGERTKEIAKRKIDEVRQACCNLFGWTMRINGATYRLSSIYAEGQEDVLLFGMGENGAASLLENGYTARISDEVEQLVHKWNSVPALLASVTLSNFEKTTVMVEHGS